MTPTPIADKPAYAIVGCHKLEELPIVVNEQVQNGYEPIGGPFLETTRMIWCQAIFRAWRVIAEPAPIKRTW